MFTIKHINPYGLERIWQCKAVVKEATQSGETEIYAPTPDHGDAMPNPITSGTLYVMNDNGKTVATYHLGSPQVVPGDLVPPVVQ